MARHQWQQSGQGPGPRAVIALASLLATGCGVERGTGSAHPAEARLAELLARYPAAFAQAAPSSRAAGATVSVGLPRVARGAMRITDATGTMTLRVSLEGATRAPLVEAEGIAYAARGYRGTGDLLYRVGPDGVEDFVAFDTRPAEEELVYALDLDGVAGLRAVADTLELLDASGTPRLRVAPPSVLEATGAARPAGLSVSGCAVDHDPRPPWHRPVTPPGASRCRLHVTFAGVRYPALVDPAWTSTGIMATAREGHAAVRLGDGRVLIVGGNDVASGALATAELFDPVTRTFSPTGALDVGRAGPRGALLPSGKVLVAGGLAAYQPSNLADVYDPATGTFSPTGPMTGTYAQHTLTPLGSGRVLIAGGGRGELYDETTGQFSATGFMVQNRTGHSATLLESGQVLVAGGTFKTATHSGAELYDPVTGQFSATGSMTTGRVGHTATRLPSGKVLVAGGGLGMQALASAELYDPASGTFSLTGSLARPRIHHAATALATGAVLVTGGGTFEFVPDSENLGLVPHESVEVYDPVGGSFVPAGALPAPRAAHSSTLLTSGAVLVAGGWRRDPVRSLSSAALFQPSATGAACQASGECPSFTCQDGVCCAGPCQGTCMTCLPTTGACVTVKDAEDPDTCSGTMTCGPSGACGKKRAEPCAADLECATGHCADGRCCDQACAGGGCDRCDLPGTIGTCVIAPAGSPGAGPACVFPLVCDGARASCQACAGDAGCAPGYFCGATGACQPRRGLGDPCDARDCLVPGCGLCASGHCVDGVCCESACDGLCQACAAALKASGNSSGSCGPARAGTNPHADACPKGAATSCGPDGTCDGLGGCRPFAPAGSACGPGECDGTSSRPRTCDGVGACALSSAVTECAPFGCAGGACATTCAATADCAPGAFCSAGACAPRRGLGERCATPEACQSGFCADGVCCDRACAGQCEACDATAGACAAVSGAPRGSRPPCALGTVCSATTGACAAPPGAGPVCDGDHTVTGQDLVLDCSPYRCVSDGTCRKACRSVEDCVAGTLCDREGRCVAPMSTPVAAQGDGCTATPGGHPATSAPAWVALALLGLARRSRRRTIGGGFE